ncbi:hypothetical protein [Flectobacillus roseus]|uniref:Uncharacterized protein n=1 Tax=Flectobacillus roseus TaxID=502259 RepID=A0ABT6Y2V9_9BACT|nr:hypothetical protein [Flectobacillus roseus]MDI9857903.1 hypothetical protein [Flectobacillus roseus]
MNIPELIRSLSADPLMQFILAMCLGAFLIAMLGEVLNRSEFLKDLLYGKDTDE